MISINTLLANKTSMLVILMVFVMEAFTFISIVQLRRKKPETAKTSKKTRQFYLLIAYMLLILGVFIFYACITIPQEI